MHRTLKSTLPKCSLTLGIITAIVYRKKRVSRSNLDIYPRRYASYFLKILLISKVFNKEKDDGIVLCPEDISDIYLIQDRPVKFSCGCWGGLKIFTLPSAKEQSYQDVQNGEKEKS